MSDLRIFLFCSLGFFLIAFSCDSNGESEDPSSDEKPLFNQAQAVDTPSISTMKRAICIWPGAGVRKEPGKKKFTKDKQSNYITSLEYGEMAELLGEQDTVSSENNRVYIKVRLLDGKEGWVDEYLFEKHGRRAVITQETEIYRRPDLMTVRNLTLEPGEIVVTLETKDNWLHVSGREKKKKGWVRIEDSKVSYNMQDIELANYFYKAKRFSSAEEKRRRLTELVKNRRFEGSVLLELVHEKLREVENIHTGSEGPREMNAGRGSSPTRSEQDHKLLITSADASIHSEPNIQDSIILKDLSVGEECIVLSKGESVTLGNKKDYWYKVQYGDQEGWVFGYYTSLRSTE